MFSSTITSTNQYTSRNLTYSSQLQYLTLQQKFWHLPDTGRKKVTVQNSWYHYLGYNLKTVSWLWNKDYCRHKNTDRQWLSPLLKLCWQHQPLFNLVPGSVSKSEIPLTLPHHAKYSISVFPWIRPTSAPKCAQQNHMKLRWFQITLQSQNTEQIHRKIC